MTTFDLGPADLADGAIRAATAGDRELAVARLGDRHVATDDSIDVFPAAVDSEGRIVAEIPILPA